MNFGKSILFCFVEKIYFQCFNAKKTFQKKMFKQQHCSKPLCLSFCECDDDVVERQTMFELKEREKNVCKVLERKQSFCSLTKREILKNLLFAIASKPDKK